MFQFRNVSTAPVCRHKRKEIEIKMQFPESSGSFFSQINKAALPCRLIVTEPKCNRLEVSCVVLTGALCSVGGEEGGIPVNDKNDKKAAGNSEKAGKVTQRDPLF